MNLPELRSCRHRAVNRRPGQRAVPVVTVIVSVWDIHRLCECDWIAPDYAAGVRTWRRIPDSSCPYCIRSAVSRAWATPVGVAA